MEGRLMLSTVIANIDFAPLNLTIVQFDLESAAPTPSAVSHIAMASASEGGFIVPLTSTFPRAISFDGDAPILSFPDSAGYSVSPPSTPSDVTLSGQTNNEETLYYANANVQPGPVAAADAPGVGGFDLQPSVIPVWESRPNRSSVDSNLASAWQGPVLSEEGGPIQIESMLSSIASLSRPGLGQEIASSAPVGDSAADDASPRLAASSPAEGGTVSGELARAMAFELAGGEPAEGQRGAQTGRREAAPTPEASRPTSREPLSSAPEADRDAIPIDSVAMASPDGMEGRDTVLIPGPEGQFASIQRRNGGHTIGPFVGPRLLLANVPVALAPPKAAPLDRAREEAFEGLATEEVAGGSLGLEFSLRGALNATPLLMVLALERIAASKSRRLKRHDAFVSAPRRPSRNSLRGGEQLV
jgi:hypothetical protein